MKGGRKEGGWEGKNGRGRGGEKETEIDRQVETDRQSKKKNGKKCIEKKDAHLNIKKQLITSENNVVNRNKKQSYLYVTKVEQNTRKINKQINE